MVGPFFSIFLREFYGNLLAIGYRRSNSFKAENVFFLNQPMG